MAEKATPDTPAPFYAAALQNWNVVSALLKGSTALRSEVYLPRHSAETDDAYQARVSRTFCYRGFRKAVRNVVARVFSKPLTLTADMPDPIKLLCDDIDLEGRNLDRFARRYFYNALAFGACYLLVDFTRVEPGATAIADAEARPFFKLIPATSLIDAERATIGGKTVITYARILETATVRDGYSQRQVRRVRELWPDRFQLHEQNEKGEWSIIESGPIAVGGEAWDRVPMVPLVLGEEGLPFEYEPPMMDVAEKNIELFQNESDQNNILTFARFPMLAHKGPIPQQQDEKGELVPFQVGPRTVLSSGDTAGLWYYVEPKGDAIAAGANHIERLKKELEELGMMPLLDRVSSDTFATMALLGSAEAHSAAQAMANEMRDAIAYALWMLGRWMRIDEVGNVNVNSDFAMGSTRKDDIDALDKARGRRDISRATYWEEMQRKGVLSSTFDPKQEETRILSEADDMAATVSEDAEDLAA